MTTRFVPVALAAALATSACADDKLDAAMLQEVADEMNRSLPSMQDEETRLDEVIVGPGLAWTYKFTLVNADSSPEVVEAVKRDYVPKLISKFCSLPATQVFLEENIETRMEHIDRNGKLVSSVILNREACS
jgi:hypothetical protein